MKSTSIFVAVGLAFCQLAAAAPKASSANSIDIQWWTQTNFTGSTDSGDAMPGKCYSLRNPFRDTVQSLQVDSESTCLFFILDACVGQSLFLNGSMEVLPSPFPNNTLSYMCADDTSD
ncbi:hypothetical protein PILCRDRAFT_811025 [Piloderma croceum F 1598]|uniref:Cyanovirin-N domain-containing protein n=1 Tax=Piloderma croceum (strain F 1598) TaxID=765440 RepID=A0A0C3GMJ3_PILCF|nr:hypothetical protein PILCRDRAFT_811025 [Piloderma croceum F 1598]